MSVEIANSSALEAKPEAKPEANQPEERFEHQKTLCPNCETPVILLARTIQTFCYSCGEPVTQLDQAGMYYELREL